MTKTHIGDRATGVNIFQQTEAKRPEPDPITSSLLDHFPAVENAQFGLRNDAGLWISYNCLDTFIPTPTCPNPLSEKIFAFGAWQPAFTFAMHGGVQCKAVGLDVEDQKAEVKRVFERNEAKGIEQALLLNRFVANSVQPVGPVVGGTPVSWAAPVDVSPPPVFSGTSAIVMAMAALEGYAAANYAGLPTIHMPRTCASALAQYLVWEDGKAYSRSGSKIAIGGGYDDPTNPDGTFELYATGDVLVERSSEIDIQTYVIPGDGTTTIDGSDIPNPLSDNSVMALAERMYRVTVDCFVAQAFAKVW